MGRAKSHTATDLTELTKGYSYDEQSFTPLYTYIAEKIAAYDPHFGPVLTSHLQRVQHHTEQFMLSEGYDSDTAKKAAHGFGLHDVGKLLQDPDLWRQTVEKRVFTPEQKMEREKHGRLGIRLLEEAMSEMAFTPDAHQARHLDLVKYLMVNHHERLNGSGPEHMPGHAMDNILKIVTIIDTVDGKIKAKGLSAIFDDMSGTEGTKHEGQFDKALVARYEAYYRASPYANAQPVLANQAHSL